MNELFLKPVYVNWLEEEEVAELLSATSEKLSLEGTVVLLGQTHTASLMNRCPT